MKVDLCQNDSIKKKVALIPKHIFNQKKLHFNEKKKIQSKKNSV